MAANHRTAFLSYLQEKYKGKVHRIEIGGSPYFNDTVVHVEFRIPVDDADELEMYRRINKVIEVIAEGDDG
jgi:hypothetical protein